MADVIALTEIEVSVETEEEIAGAEEAVARCAEWFERDRNAKEPIIQEWEEMDKLYRGDHWDLLGPEGRPLRTDEQKANHPHAVENIGFALVEGLVAEFSQDVDIVDFPVEEGDDDTAALLTDLKRYLSYKNRIAVERQKFNRNLFKYGTGIWHVYWDPYWRGGRGRNRWLGEIRWRSLHPQAFFPDARCRENIEEAQRVHKAVYLPIEEVRRRYPQRGHLVQAEPVDDRVLLASENEFLQDAFTDEQVLLVETWYKGRPLVLRPGEDDRGDGLHVIWWANTAQRVYLHHANYVYFEPGEDARYPYIVRQCYPRENSIWGYGELHVLKWPQIILNRTVEMILEAHGHNALGQTLYEPDAVTPSQKAEIMRRGTIPGIWLEVQRINGIEKLPGQNAPSSLITEVQRLQRVMETLIGRFDISQGRTPGSVTAFRALDLLAQRAQVRLRSKDLAITTAYEEVGSYINHLITRHYTEERAFRIIGPDGKQVRRGVFRMEDVLKVYVPSTGDVYRFKEFEPTPGWVEGVDYEVYSPEFDTICRVSTAMPSDRLFYMEMAKELFLAKLIDADTFWYVLDNGRFPPWEYLQQKMAIQSLGQQMLGGVGQGVAPVEQQVQALLGALPPEMQQLFASLPPQTQQQILAQALAAGGGYGAPPQGP